VSLNRSSASIPALQKYNLAMDVDAIRRYCLSFPHTTENLQWGEELCFKVRGKIFTMLALGSVPPRVCFKCTPEEFAQLVELEGIIPAPYVGRYKWVLLEHLNALRDLELEDLIRQSYEMVSAKAKPSTRRDGRDRKASTKRKN
jgi:predicted DNA-binding protein (MmcQ/YjbR family)